MKGSATYKLIVPERVEEKIRYLLRKFPHTEWSGVLFVSHKGTFENNDLVVTCEDIFPMDLGNAVYTEFNMSEDVAAYMAENIELFDCDLQLLHSHHYMSCTPSGTDLQTLREEGNERNCFVSLIVNNAGKYYAAITRKVQTKSEITIKNLGTSYEFFGEGTKEITHDGTETTKTIDKEVIQYFDLEVERHEVSNTLSYLDDRFDEIAKKKAAKEESSNNAIQSKSFLDWLHEDKQPKEGEIFDNGVILPQKKEKAVGEEIVDEVLGWQPDPNEIHRAAVKMVTCNLIINPDKFDFKQWIAKHLNNVYERVFPDKQGFDEWRDFIVQYTLDYFNAEDAPLDLLEDMTLFEGKIAKALCDELSVYNNPYIQDYCDLLYQYIVD